MNDSSFDKEYTLCTLVALIIAQYSLNSYFNEAPDVSIQEAFLIKKLKIFGCSIEEIDDAIATMDFTGQLCHYGSGNKERNSVMDYIKEVYYA